METAFDVKNHYFTVVVLESKNSLNYSSISRSPTEKSKVIRYFDILLYFLIFIIYL